jgi:hypothetical protein
MEIDRNPIRARRRFLGTIVAAWAFGGGIVCANPPSACEDALFAGYVPTFQSGDVLPKEGVFAIALQPIAAIVFFLPANAGARTGFGGIVTFENLPTGRFAVMLSEDAVLEAVHHRPFAPVRMRRTGESTCSRLAEIIIDGGPLTLQVSTVATPSIKIAVVRLY